MSFLVPLLYITGLSFWLSRMQGLRRAGFGKRFVVLFFVAKCGAGFVYNFIALHLPHRGDIWPFFEDGLDMYRLFLQSPQAFLQTYGQIFHYSDFDATNTNSDFIRSAFAVIRLLHFVLNFLTGGNLWGNTVLFNFGATVCFFYCWRFLKSHSGEQGNIIGLVFLLLPSLFFYSAGILKEGIVISLLCGLVPLSHKMISTFSVKALVAWLLLFALLGIVKVFVAGLWLAAMLLWVLLRWFRAKQGRVTLLAIGVASIAFFLSSYTSGIDLSRYLIRRQQEFLALPAGSFIYIEPLTEQPASYIKALPVALNNVLFKPLPGEGGKALYSLYAVEMLLFWAGVVFVFLKRKREPVPLVRKTLAIVFGVFAFFNLLFIGLIVPNIGSIIRYRSIFMPFLAIAILLLCRPQFVSEKWNKALEKWIGT